MRLACLLWQLLALVCHLERCEVPPAQSCTSVLCSSLDLLRTAPQPPLEPLTREVAVLYHSPPVRIAGAALAWAPLPAALMPAFTPTFTATARVVFAAQRIPPV